MTGTRAWFPTAGSAGGMPGATMRFAMTRADGTFEPVDIHQVGVALAPGDRFEMYCASGGGYGDPLDREPGAVLAGHGGGPARREDCERHLWRGPRTLPANWTLPRPKLVARRSGASGWRMRGRRFARLAKLPQLQRSWPKRRSIRASRRLETWPFGSVAGSARHRARQLARWLPDPRHAISTIRAGGTIARAHLDPASGRMLFVDVIRKCDGPSIEVRPHRWAIAGHNLPKAEGAGE